MVALKMKATIACGARIVHKVGTGTPYWYYGHPPHTIKVIWWYLSGVEDQFSFCKSNANT